MQQIRQRKTFVVPELTNFGAIEAITLAASNPTDCDAVVINGQTITQSSNGAPSTTCVNTIGSQDLVYP